MAGQATPQLPTMSAFFKKNLFCFLKGKPGTPIPMIFNFIEVVQKLQTWGNWLVACAHRGTTCSGQDWQLWLSNVNSKSIQAPNNNTLCHWSSGQMNKNNLYFFCRQLLQPICWSKKRKSLKIDYSKMLVLVPVCTHTHTYTYAYSAEHLFSTASKLKTHSNISYFECTFSP